MSYELAADWKPAKSRCSSLLLTHSSWLTANSSHWGGWGRTSNLPVNSRALCQLSYTPRWNRRTVTLHEPHQAGKPNLNANHLSLHALLLAAGRGERFGGSKLQAEYRQRPLLAYPLALIAA